MLCKGLSARRCDKKPHAGKACVRQEGRAALPGLQKNVYALALLRA